MRVSEIFYSLQGEGGRAGEASVFVRLSGCSAKHACAASGVVCDTEFESGEEMTIGQLDAAMMASVRRVVGDEQMFSPTLLPWIIWTGGEPLDQLTVDIIEKLRHLGWKRQAIETSGVKEMSLELRKSLDWVTVSPKVAEHILERHFPWAVPSKGAGSHDEPVDELRYVRHAGQPGVPQPKVVARHYCLSPHSDGNKINTTNLQHCIRLCLAHPQWRLSVQQHKQWVVL